MHRAGRLGTTFWTAHTLLAASTARAFRCLHPTTRAVHSTSTMAAAAAAAAMTSTASSDTSRKPKLRGVIFDMDGTLTIPNLDFGEMYDRCGVDRSQDILTAIAAMDETAAARANAIIDDMEEEGRRTLQLMPGTLNLLQWLAYYQIPTALVTRNTDASTQRLLELLQDADPDVPRFSPIISRDFQPETIRPKPHPDALEYIANEWKMPLTQELVMVGDSPANDIVFGQTAGVSTALLWQKDGNGDGTSDGVGGADVVVSWLAELPRHFHQNFALPVPVGLEALRVPGTAPRPSSMAGKAAYHGDLDILQSLDIEEVVPKDDSGNTPLIWASEAGQMHVVEYLLGVIVKSSDSAGQHNHINEKGYRGSTAVSRASRNGHTEVVSILTNHPGINTNIPNLKLQFPLHVAAFRQHSSIVQVLLQSGADPHVTDLQGRTPLEDTNCSKTKELLRNAME